MVDVGRVFYDYDKFPNEINTAFIVPLETHTCNVVRLVEEWDNDSVYRTDRPLEKTRELVLRAARLHDIAKPRTFRVTYDAEQGFSYSFRGHRFDVMDDNTYVQLLIRLHHEFSVNGIVEAQAQLREQEKFASIADNFPLDLYTLEMCDQIAAEAECYAMQQQPNPRVFIEFHSKQRDDGMVEVEPYPFRNSPLSLTIDLIQITINERMRAKIRAEIDGGHREITCLRDLLRNPSAEERQSKEVVLCSPTN